MPQQLSSTFIADAADRLKAATSRSESAPVFLYDAARVVAERRSAYGPPTSHFAKTIALVNVLLRHKLREPLSIEDWPQIMICDKLAREQSSHKQDNLTDIAGYTACWSECLKNE